MRYHFTYTTAGILVSHVDLRSDQPVATVVTLAYTVGLWRSESRLLVLGSAYQVEN